MTDVPTNQADTVLAERRPLPVGSIAYHSSGFWGVLCVVLTEAALFAYLLFSYYYIAVRAHPAWPPSGPPSFKISAPDTLVLILSSVAVWWGESGLRRHGHRGRLLLGLSLGLILGIVFIALQGLEWSNKPFSLSSDAYGALFFTVTGFHVAHVVIGVLVLASLLVWSALGYFGPRRHAPVTIGSIYWHFVDAVWIMVFFTFYVTPYLR